MIETEFRLPFTQSAFYLLMMHLNMYSAYLKVHFLDNFFALPFSLGMKIVLAKCQVNATASPLCSQYVLRSHISYTNNTICSPGYE